MIKEVLINKDLLTSVKNNSYKSFPTSSKK